MSFAPSLNRCTTFRNVRILKFDEEAIEVTLTLPFEGHKVFVNTKPFHLYYNTDTLKVMNVLQEIKLKSKKDPKLKEKRVPITCTLEDIIYRSNIEKLLAEYVKTI